MQTLQDSTRKQNNTPTTAEVAGRLGVDTVLLRRYADELPNPTPDALLRWADADPKHKPFVTAWLAGRSSTVEAPTDKLLEEADELLADRRRFGPDGLAEYRGRYHD